MNAFVIYHEEMGVYLGHAIGLGFWSKLDPAGQPSAVCFPTADAAREHAQSWETQVSDLQFVAVDADDVGRRESYATAQACANAGLPAWQPDRPPIASGVEIRNLYLIVKADVDPASVWDSCIIAATSEAEALAWVELTEDDIDHITQCGTAESFIEAGILLSQKD